jgi:hypothetical protein
LTSCDFDVPFSFMSDLAAMADRHESLLAELSQLGMGLARDLQARAVAASDDEKAAAMALAFHRISRSLRQTIALEAKLAHARHAPSIKAAELAQRHARVRRRHAEVVRAVENHIWTEHEGLEAELLAEEACERLSEAMKDEGFPDVSVEAHVARLCADMGVAAPGDIVPDDGADAWPEEGEPHPPPGSAAAGSACPVEAAEDGWRSSA